MDSIVRARSAAQPIKTVVVNLFAGPGAGKSTCAWEIASKLKKQGYVAEYVSEYAKDLVWDERFDLLDGSLEHQTMIYNEQKHRQDRLMGKVDFIVTDSPTILNTQYLKESAPEFVKDCIAEYKSHNNFSIFIQRAKAYEQVGRIQTEEQARQLDDKIRDMLKINDIYFGTYKHETVDLSIENMIKTYERTNNTINEKKLDAEPDSNVEPPDPSITISDMQEYGYTWDGMLPLKEEAALHLYEEEDMQIFLLHADGSESIPDSAEDIIAHAEKGGVFGVHKEDWNALTKYRAMKEELAESAEDIIAHIDQAAAIFQPADMSATNKGARSDQPTPFYDIEAIKAVPIADVCEALGFQPQAKGGRMWCAVRDERTPSCCLYIDSNTFCDFGNGNIGGSNIDLVRYVLNCDNAQAIRLIAEMFGIDPENNVRRAPTNSLIDSEWARIGIDGSLATKNFDFNIEKYGVRNTAEFSKKYSMTVNELRSSYPKVYENMIKNRALPAMYSDRNSYYSMLYFKDVTAHELKIDIIRRPDMLADLEAEAKRLNLAEKAMKKAVSGTDIKYSPKIYGAASDLEAIRAGKIKPEIGNLQYNDLKREQTKAQRRLNYLEVPVAEYNSGRFGKIPHAAFVNAAKGTVNLSFSDDNRRLIEAAVNCNKPRRQSTTV